MEQGRLISSSSEEIFSNMEDNVKENEETELQFVENKKKRKIMKTNSKKVGFATSEDSEKDDEELVKKPKFKRSLKKNLGKNEGVRCIFCPKQLQRCYRELNKHILNRHSTIDGLKNPGWYSGLCAWIKEYERYQQIANKLDQCVLHEKKLNSRNLFQGVVQNIRFKTPAEKVPYCWTLLIPNYYLEIDSIHIVNGDSKKDKDCGSEVTSIRKFYTNKNVQTSPTNNSGTEATTSANTILSVADVHQIPVVKYNIKENVKNSNTLEKLQSQIDQTEEPEIWEDEDEIPTSPKKVSILNISALSKMSSDTIDVNLSEETHVQKMSVKTTSVNDEDISEENDIDSSPNPIPNLYVDRKGLLRVLRRSSRKRKTVIPEVKKSKIDKKKIKKKDKDK